jgi:hypothetical protein
LFFIVGGILTVILSVRASGRSVVKMYFVPKSGFPPGLPLGIFISFLSQALFLFILVCPLTKAVDKVLLIKAFLVG